MILYRFRKQNQSWSYFTKLIFSTLKYKACLFSSHSHKLQVLPNKSRVTQETSSYLTTLVLSHKPCLSHLKSCSSSSQSLSYPQTSSNPTNLALPYKARLTPQTSPYLVQLHKPCLTAQISPFLRNLVLSHKPYLTYLP